MADKETKEAAQRRRKVKNPETFRERALKATTVEDDKTTKRANAIVGAGNLFRPLKKAWNSVANFPPFKPLRKPMRIIGLIIFPVYFRRSWQELKLVTWPGFKQSLRLTWAVLLFAIIFGTAVALVDYGLDAVFKRILLK